MKKVKYLRDITTPAAQSGRAGEIKELPDRLAKSLIAGGYVSADLKAKTVKEVTREKQTRLIKEKKEQADKEDKRKRQNARMTADRIIDDNQKSEKNNQKGTDKNADKNGDTAG